MWYHPQHERLPCDPQALCYLRQAGCGRRPDAPRACRPCGRPGSPLRSRRGSMPRHSHLTTSVPNASGSTWPSGSWRTRGCREIIARWQAGVPVRILDGHRGERSTPRNITRLAEFEAAGIPMRERFTGGILHWKMMLFAGQGIVEFSGANYSSDAWIPSGDPLHQLHRRIDPLQPQAVGRQQLPDEVRRPLDEQRLQYRNYANIPATRTRVYGTFADRPGAEFRARRVATRTARSAATSRRRARST